MDGAIVGWALTSVEFPGSKRLRSSVLFNFTSYEGRSAISSSPGPCVTQAKGVKGEEVVKGRGKTSFFVIHYSDGLSHG